MTLFVKEIMSIGAVDSGDNPEADIVFWKRRAARKQTADRGIIEKKETAMIEGFDLSGLPDETREGLVAFIEKLAAERDAALEAPPALEPVEKALDPETAELIAKFQHDLAAKDEALADEIRKRRDTEAVAKVREDGLEPLLGNAEQVGPNLRALEDAAPEAFAAVYSNLVAAAQRVDLAKAFEEIGENVGETPTDPIDRRDAWVAKKKAGGDSRPVHELRKEFWELHPEAVRESREAR